MQQTFQYLDFHVDFEEGQGWIWGGGGGGGGGGLRGLRGLQPPVS